VKNGVEPSKITILGKGQSSPIADNATKEGRAKNRRVEVMVKGAVEGQ
jgi:OOP family OmpA-OmpF porin